LKVNSQQFYLDFIKRKIAEVAGEKLQSSVERKIVQTMIEKVNWN